MPGEGLIAEAAGSWSGPEAVFFAVLAVAVLGMFYFLHRVANSVQSHVQDCAEERRKQSGTVKDLHTKIDDVRAESNEETRKQNEILGEIRADLGYVRGTLDIKGRS